MITYGYPGDNLAYIRDLWRWRSGFSLPPVLARVSHQTLLQTLLRGGVALFGPIGGYNFLLIFILLLNLTTAFYLVRKLTSRRDCGIIAAVTYGFSLYNLWQAMPHPELVLGAGWLPLYVLALINLGNTLQKKPFGLKIPNPKGWEMRVFPGRVSRRGLHTASLRATILTALAFALVFLSSFYIGFFAVLFTFGFLLLSLLKELTTTLHSVVVFPKRRYHSDSEKEISLTTTLCSVVVKIYQVIKQPVLRFVAHCSLFAILCFIFTLPGTYPLFRYHLNPQDISPQSQSIRQTLELRQSDEVIAYGARPWDYLIPSIFHPVYGKYVEPFYQWLEKTGGDFRFISPYLPERVNYIPITILILAGYAIFHSTQEMLRNRTGTSPKHTNVFMFALLALWMFAVSMPAFFFVGPIRIYFPSHYLFKFLPMFRVYARAGIFVLLCVTVLAAYGIKFLAATLTPKKVRLLCLGVGFLILFENLNSPPFHLLDLSKTPEVYRWLASQPEETTIIDYPRDMEPGGGCTPNVDPEVRKDFCPSCGLYFQTIHRKAVFTGDSLELPDRQTISDLANPQTHQILSANGVDLIIVHTADPFPQKNPLDSCQSRRIMEKPERVAPGFKLLEEFDGAVVYEVLSQD